MSTRLKSRRCIFIQYRNRKERGSHGIGKQSDHRRQSRPVTARTRYLPSGEAVTNISVATTETWKDKTSGEKKEATEWHRISAFGKLAEIMGEYLKKGSQVISKAR